jgi:hypothetical protein
MSGLAGDRNWQNLPGREGLGSLLSEWGRPVGVQRLDRYAGVELNIDVAGASRGGVD